MIILSAAAVRAAESAANAAGRSYEKMMEMAGAGAAKELLAALPGKTRFAVLCGKGRNGGDGFVAARLLAEAGKAVTVIRVFDAAGDKLSESMAARMPETVRTLIYSSQQTEAENALIDAEAIVDAVFGIGFRGTLPEEAARLIRLSNALPAFRAAIDLPSGVGADSEEPEPFRADLTLSMLCLKPEHVDPAARRYCGETRVVPIGITASGARENALTRKEAAALLPKRPVNAHKGTFGHVLVLGGSANMPGAPMLAAEGALRSGAGLVTLALPAVHFAAAAARLPECVFAPMPTEAAGSLQPIACGRLLRETACSAVVFGNGVGRGTGLHRIAEDLLRIPDRPAVLDADGINAAASHIDMLKEAKCPVILTPHPGEMSRLTGKTVAEIEADRAGTAKAFAARYGVYVLLKGALTVIAGPEGEVWLNPTGSTALSRGGSGDVLAGVIGALLAQGLSPWDALRLAAYAHGLAGELSEERCSAYGATTDENLKSVSLAFRLLSKGM